MEISRLNRNGQVEASNRINGIAIFVGVPVRNRLDLWAMKSVGAAGAAGFIFLSQGLFNEDKGNP